MDRKFVVAYDIGTSGVKVALITPEGKVIATATATYPLIVPQDGWAEQNPEAYWEGVCAVTQEVFSERELDPANAIGLAFGTQWKGIIPVDVEGRVLHNSIIWLDARAVDQAKRLNERFGEGTFAGNDYWPKLLWLRENRPEAYEKAEIIFEANSYLKWKTTGESAVDITNSFVRSYDPKIQKLYKEILAFGNLDLEKFPKIIRSQDLAGHVTERAAEEMGLVPGIPVFGGCGDIPAIAIGSGCSDIGGTHVYFGSSGWGGYSVPHSSEELYISPFDAERDIYISGLNAIGLSLNWAVSRLYYEEFKEMGAGVFGLVNEEAAQVPPGCEDLLAMPWFYGERPPLLSENARGSFWNLGTQHDRRHMTRAVMEGICYTLKTGALHCKASRGYVWPTQLNAIGGGSASDVWMQTLANVMNMPVCVPYSPRHAGAVGTAYCALVGLGLRQDFSEIARTMEFERRFDPQPEAVAVYEEGFAKFDRIRRMLLPLFNENNGSL